MRNPFKTWFFKENRYFFSFLAYFSIFSRCEHTPPHLLKPLNELDPAETEEQRNRRAALRVMETADPSADPLSLLAQAALAVNAQQVIFPLFSLYLCLILSVRAPPGV